MVYFTIKKIKNDKSEVIGEIIGLNTYYMATGEYVSVQILLYFKVTFKEYFPADFSL